MIIRMDVSLSNLPLMGCGRLCSRWERLSRIVRSLDNIFLSATCRELSFRAGQKPVLMSHMGYLFVSNNIPVNMVCFVWFLLRNWFISVRHLQRCGLISSVSAGCPDSWRQIERHTQVLLFYTAPPSRKSVMGTQDVFEDCLFCQIVNNQTDTEILLSVSTASCLFIFRKVN